LKTNIVAINVTVNHQRFAHDVDYIRAAVYQNSGCRVPIMANPVMVTPAVFTSIMFAPGEALESVGLS
jgi:hypothetical protein